MTQPARATDTTLPKASAQSRQWNLRKARRPGPESDTSRWSFHLDADDSISLIDPTPVTCKIAPSSTTEPWTHEPTAAHPAAATRHVAKVAMAVLRGSATAPVERHNGP